jgi:hypothetical protein
MAWNPEDPIEKQKRIAWEIAMERAVVTKEDALLLYNRLMEQNELLRISTCDTDKT